METPTLYAVEINEPYQINAEYKFRCFVQVDDEGSFSWTSKPERTFVTTREETAQEIADSLAESWGALVKPVEMGCESSLSDDALVKAFRDRQRERGRQARHIR